MHVFLLMGLFNSGFLISETDLSAMEFSFLLRSTFQRDVHDGHYLTVNSEQDDEDEDIGRRRQAVQEEEKDGTASRGFLSSSDECKVEDDDNGFKTPTALDHKIPTILRCPMAPRKPKSRPVTKRKASERQRLLLDLSGEIQSLFPADFLVELGGKIKRVRQDKS